MDEHSSITDSAGAAVDVALESGLASIQSRALDELRAAPNEPLLVQVKARYLGKKGELTAQMKRLGTLPPDERRGFGAQVNQVKEALEAAFEARLQSIQAQGLQTLASNRPDLTLPGRPLPAGRVHPLTRVMEEIEDAFLSLGFDIQDGPDIEDDWHNFEALNIPEGHPAREMQDTFYLQARYEGKPLVLRTHTSPVQMRTMLAQDPPLRMIAPGTVYRSDYDATHSPMFHQFEGLVVDKGVSLSDLKGVLLQFVRRMFGPQTDIKFRASFFPFTEPSAEIDMLCFQCGGKGCRLCKDTGWIEIGGCGMVNPEVFRFVGKESYDPANVQGFAFGMGIERIAMLKYQFNDIRHLFENDLRLLHQF